MDETHLGKIVTNKTTGNGHIKRPSDAKKFKQLDKKYWNEVKGRHEAVKTQNEHDRILLFLARDTKAPKRRSGAKKYSH